MAGTCASCSVEEQELPAEELYTREFYKTFGTFSQNQDWSVVEQKSVTINTATPANVEIFEKQAGEYKLAANYSNVTGSQTITFDGVEGDNTPFIVSIDGNKMLANNGETLDYKGNSVSGIKRTSVIPSDDSWLSHDGTSTTLLLNSSETILSYLSEKNGQSNIGGMPVTVSSDKAYMETLTKDGGAVYYPVLHKYDKELTAGIYYYDINTGNINLVPMYSTTGTSEFGELTSDNKITSYGYHIKPTQTALIGVYVTDGTNTYYSDASLNSDKKPHFGINIQQGTIDASESENYTYLCFDADGDDDYNDLVFVSPRKMSAVTRDEISWLVACEDLGGTYDYDFNDLVFRVYHLSGNDYLTIVPVAAGGTLQAWLCYGTEDNYTELSNEWHKHFNAQSNDYNIMYNTNWTGSNSSTVNKVKPIRVTGLPTSWSMKSFTADPNAQDGNFLIKVIRADGTQYSVTAPSAGRAPQMLILNSDWQWPTEMTPITSAYPQFGEWGKNYTNSSWVKTVTEGTTVNMSENVFTSAGIKTVNLSNATYTTKNGTTLQVNGENVDDSDR